MKRIVDGLRYDTEKAELVAEWHNSYYPSDFSYCEESLYRTKKGAYFTAGEGGPMSKYAEPCGSNGRCGGSDITVLTEGEAISWLEEHGLTRALEEHFSSQIEDA